MIRSNSTKHKRVTDKRAEEVDSVDLNMHNDALELCATDCGVTVLATPSVECTPPALSAASI